MEYLNSLKIYRRVIWSGLSLIKIALRPRRWYVYALFLIIICFTILLAVIANAQAGDVKGEAYPEGQVGLFEYHAEIVDVRPVSANAAESIEDLAGKRVFLLGQNAQYIVVYSPASRSTIRIPVNTEVVTSTP